MGDDALPEIFSMSAPALVTQFERLAGAPGGVERLRELILTLAVRGKLVSQEPSDEPASALLQGIRAEKERRIADGCIKPDKASSEAIDQHPFEIPETWIWVSMGEVVEIVRGITFPASEKTKESGPGRIACLRTANVQESIEWDDLLFVSRSFMGREDQLLKLHDIVMSMANSRELVGKVALVDQIPHAESTFGGFLGVLRPWRIDPRYAMAVLRSSYARSTLIDSSSQTTNIANISLGKLRPLPFPLPPLAEQARIVARVDELMQLCDALEAKGRLEAQQHARLLETLLGTLTDSTTPEELAANWQRVAEHFDLLLDRPEAVDVLEQTVLQLAVRGLLVPQASGDQPASSLLEQMRASGVQKKAQGRRVEAVVPEVQLDEVPFELPESWAWSRFGQVAEIASDLVQPAGHGSEWQVAPDCIEKGTGRLLAKRTVADADVKSANHRFHPGQIIYSKIRPSLSKAVIVDFAGLCSADMYPINAKISTQYLLLVILSRCFLDQVAAAENRVKMPKLNQEALAAFLVPVPPLAEQERIVARVTDLRRLCTDLRYHLRGSSATQAALAEALIDYALAG